MRTWRRVRTDGSIDLLVATSRRELTTSTVVVADGRALLIDPAWEPDELADLAAALTGTGTEVVVGFATHAHHDHVLWHPSFGSAPRFASRRAADVCAREHARIVERLGPEWPADLAALVGQVAPAGGDTLDWPGPTVHLLTHDAHSPGHTALWLPAHGVLIAADMLSDVELPLLEESTPAQYAAGLDLLHPYTASAEVLVPGHGRVALGAAAAQRRWRADRDYLVALTTGAEPTDPRLDNPGMPQAHAENVAAVRRAPR
jgi:glyoxylase-like metal-dependent hydrolase (beta-lactamase superfamily II)